MNKNQTKQKFTSNLKIASTFLILPFIIFTNVHAIKLTLNGEPSQTNIVTLPNMTELNIAQTMSVNELLSYKYVDSSGFRPIVYKTDDPYLCIGANNNSPIVSLDSSDQITNPVDLIETDPNKIRGFVGVSSLVYKYSPASISS